MRGALPFLALFATALFCPLAAAEQVRIDFSPATGRRDHAAPGWEEWQVPNGPAAEREFGGVRVELASGAESTLKGDWFKAGLVTGANMATDGVLAVDGPSPRTLLVRISGLAPGRHSATTYHNSFGKEPLPPVRVQLDKREPAGSLVVTPSVRASDNEGAAHAHLEFDVADDQPVVLRIESTGADDAAAVVLNGLEIDVAAPELRARRPRPADRDWHADGDAGSVALVWEPAPKATKQRLLVVAAKTPEEAEALLKDSTSAVAVAELDAAQATHLLPLNGNASSHLHYRWRVDAIEAEGQVVRGDVWSFRVRQLAFPGAEGYGRFAVGGRGGRVVHVTNLDDSGPGSLRAAVEAEGPRTVVFDVSGRIVLNDKLVIRNPFLTIAGQTAPGKGICISNYNLGMLGARDCIVRYIRVRPGDTAGVTLDGMGMASADHAIIDHCSISWSQDEAFSSRGAKNITLQRTLISEALNVAGHAKYKPGTQHGYAASIGGDVGSFHHNLLAHCAGRNWSLAGGVDQAGVHAGRLDIRNNVVYNWSHRTTDGGAKEVNFVNNYYKPGPASRVFHVLKPEHQLPFGPQEYFVLGNVMEGRYGANQRYAGVQESPNKPMSEYVVERPFFESFVTTTSAKKAYADVLADVGCNRPSLDDHDKRVVAEVRRGTAKYKGSKSGLPGLPDSQEDVGGWEDYPEIRRPADWDSDGDGLPDAWELARGLDPRSPDGDFSDANADPEEDGYTNLEKYLNELAAGR